MKLLRDYRLYGPKGSGWTMMIEAQGIASQIGPVPTPWEGPWRQWFVDWPSP